MDEDPTVDATVAEAEAEDVCNFVAILSSPLFQCAQVLQSTPRRLHFHLTTVAVFTSLGTLHKDFSA